MTAAPPLSKEGPQKDNLQIPRTLIPVNFLLELLPALLEHRHELLPLPARSTRCVRITIGPSFRFRISWLLPNAAEQPSAPSGLDRENLPRRGVPNIDCIVLKIILRRVDVPPQSEPQLQGLARGGWGILSWWAVTDLLSVLQGLNVRSATCSLPLAQRSIQIPPTASSVRRGDNPHPIR